MSINPNGACSLSVIIGVDPHKALNTAVAIGGDEREVAKVTRSSPNRGESESPVPPGHYSAPSYQPRSRLESPLWDELERKVAAHLRVHGQ